MYGNHMLKALKYFPNNDAGNYIDVASTVTEISVSIRLNGILSKANHLTYWQSTIKSF